MAYTRDELYEQMLASYAAQDLEGELVRLAANILADYLYLHQMEDVSILLEDSFLRSKLLSSKIQHAADNFYSVPRGKNRLIEISNLSCLAPISAKKFETISTYGAYKLVYAEDYAFAASNQSITIQAYLTVDNAQTLTLRGNGKYYMDLEDSEGNLIQDISEEIVVMSLDDGGTIDESDDVYHVFKLSNTLTDLYEDETDSETLESGGNGKKAEICPMTLPGYGVRLWKAEPFQTNYTYIIKFLKCPDPTKKELDLKKAIKAIPGYSMNIGGTTLFTEKTPQQEKESDVDRIYLASSVSQKFQSTMKSINSIDEIISSLCPLIAGFKTVIDGNGITVNYTAKQDISTLVGQDGEYYKAVSNTLKAYNITQDVAFVAATKHNYVGSAISDPSPPLYIEIHYTDLIDLTLCTTLVNNPLYVVGGTWSAYQMIADIMTHPNLLGKVSLVQIYQNSPDKQTPIPVPLNPNEHIAYNPNISYVSERI